MTKKLDDEHKLAIFCGIIIGLLWIGYNSIPSPGFGVKVGTKSLIMVTAEDTHRDDTTYARQASQP